MLIPLIPYDKSKTDFTCRDGEIAVVRSLAPPARLPAPSGRTNRASLQPEGTYPTATLRVALQSGEKEKANLLLGGEIQRVDAATAERLTAAITQKAAQALLDLTTDLRRQGLFLLPFRFFTQTMLPDGTLTSPSPQALALPTDFPPHPEITAAQATDDTLTLAIRFPVKPHRLIIGGAAGLSIGEDSLSSGETLRLYISYPLYIPDPKEMRGSIGSVRSATGGNATGIRFAFLSASSIKASVAAPEKYYEMVGNPHTGYRLSSKIAACPDYSCYAAATGFVAPFPREEMIAVGEGVDADTDPLDWIADWRESGDGYLPTLLPTQYSADETGGEEDPASSWPEGIEEEEIMGIASEFGLPNILLTRPMAFADSGSSRRNAEPRGIRWMHVQGLGDAPAVAILYGSPDCRRWTPLRRFDARRPALLQTPPRPWWRLLLLSTSPFPPLALLMERHDMD